MSTQGQAGPIADEAPAPYWKCVLAAAPELFVGLQFLMVGLYKKPFLGATRPWLAAAMQAEFLVVHSMAFLGLIALWKPVDAAAARLRAGLFWVTFALYAAAALKAGWPLFLIFIGLTFVTYLGLFLNWRSPSAQVQLGVRWAVGMALFLVALGVCGAPQDVGSWTRSSSVIAAGALYFFSLAAVELSGFHLRYIPPRSQRILAWLRSGRRRGGDG